MFPATRQAKALEAQVRSSYIIIYKVGRWPNLTLVTKEAKLNNSLYQSKSRYSCSFHMEVSPRGLKHWKSGSLRKTAVRFENQEKGEEGGGEILLQAKRIALLQFPKMWFALFIGTSKPLWDLNSVHRISNWQLGTHKCAVVQTKAKTILLHGASWVIGGQKKERPGCYNWCSIKS